jgi:hypothetical protein
VPLRRALDEVAWEVRARQAVRDALAAEPLRVVESKAQVARHGVELVVVVLGKTTEADATRRRLAQRIEGASGVRPSIEVLAVPDSTAFAGLESTLLTPRPKVAAAEPVPLADEALKASARVKAALSEVWPTNSVGDILGVSMEEGQTKKGLRLRVAHWGNPLGATGREALEKALSGSLGGPITIESIAVPMEPITRRAGDLTFIARAAAAAASVRSAEGVGICLTRPDVGEMQSPLAKQDQELARALDALLQEQPGLTTVFGKSFELRVTRGACQGPGAASTTIAGESAAAGASNETR